MLKSVSGSTGGSGGEGVTSFNSRTGAVTPESGDYSAFYMELVGGNIMTGTPGATAINLNGMWLDTADGLLIDSVAPYGVQMGSGLDMNGANLNIHGGVIEDSTGVVNFGSPVTMGSYLAMNSQPLYMNGVVYDVLGSLGGSGLVMGNDGMGNMTWVSASSNNWVSTAASNLNMNNYQIVDQAGGVLQIGSPMTMNSNYIDMNGGAFYMSGNVLDHSNSYGDPGWILHTYGDGTGVYWAAESTGGWVSTAQSDLNMNGFSIRDYSISVVNYASPISMNSNYIDLAGGALYMSGPVYDSNGSLGSGGYFMGNDGSGKMMWTTPSGGWVSTAASDLDMSGYSILNIGAMTGSGGAFQVDSSGRLSNDFGINYWQFSGASATGPTIQTGTISVTINGTGYNLMYS